MDHLHPTPLQVFHTLWLAGLAFFAANFVLVHEAVRLHHVTPLFRSGRLAQQVCLYGRPSTHEVNGQKGSRHIE